MRVKGNVQGDFKGESLSKAWQDWIPSFSYNSELIAPRDIASGLATGKRMYKPITIVKEWGDATPQFYTALATNEILKLVEFDFVKKNMIGQEYVYFKITLTNALVSDTRMFKNMQVNTQNSGYNELPELQEVSFTFQSIKIESLHANVLFMDTWVR